MGRVLAVFGISGVGKTFMASRFASAHDARHVRASELIRTAKSVSTKIRSTDELLSDNILENQRLLVQAFKQLRASEARDIIFDGHSVIDGETGPTIIPLEIIRAIGPAGFIFIHDDPTKILQKRISDKSRLRPERDVDALTNHQTHALEICIQYSSQLALNLSIVDAGDWQAFELAATALLRSWTEL